MKVEHVTFLGAARKLAGCPSHALPEFAFIGRSNVGKSSLINWLTQRKGLARVSKTPGRTREINFFSVNQQWCLVDLPGYGFAKISRDKQEEFNEFVSDYLLNRPNLAATFLLIDSRHDPQRKDLDFVRWLVECAIPFALVFTKTDKSKPRQVSQKVNQFLAAMEAFAEGKPVCFEVSSLKPDGRKELLGYVEEVIRHRS